MLLVRDLPSSVQTRPTGPLHAIIGINMRRGPATCLIVLVGTNSRAISAATTVKSVLRTGDAFHIDPNAADPLYNDLDDL